ncbi:MAG: hypothetical protein RG741_01570 [Bacteroidales bacterium]|nr:hypothetical protein [Bacteroidales bacterium]
MKAWAYRNNIEALLVSIDDDKDVFHQFGHAATALKALQGRRAGLIGGVSHWLVASAFPLTMARERFGIDVLEYPWQELPGWLSFDLDKAFVSKGRRKERPQHEFACRTQLELTLPEQDIQKLREQAPGQSSPAYTR